MKKSISKNIFLVSVIVISGLSSQAQQKVSDRPFGSELKKIKDIQKARSEMLRETQEPSTKKETEATNIPVNRTKKLPATKPSTQPMVTPARPKKQ
jgi:hypothetical protein